MSWACTMQILLLGFGKLRQQLFFFFPHRYVQSTLFHLWKWKTTIITIIGDFVGFGLVKNSTALLRIGVVFLICRGQRFFCPKGHRAESDLGSIGHSFWAPGWSGRLGGAGSECAQNRANVLHAFRDITCVSPRLKGERETQATENTGKHSSQRNTCVRDITSFFGLKGKP